MLHQIIDRRLAGKNKSIANRERFLRRVKSYIRRAVSDAVRDEPVILERQGIAFVNIPIRFDAPSDADFDAFVAAMRGFGERKVLVHCQVNLRASSMVFLYRAVVLKENPRLAYEAVEKVWVPEGAWRPFIERTLRRHGVNFEII